VLNRHRATLEIDSEPGQGSRFAAHFPRRALLN
jgi:signal transduction histidine kinase